MSSNLTIIPSLSIHPDRINIYNEIHWDGCRPGKNPHNHVTEISKQSYGRLSQQSARKLTKAADYLIYMAQPKTVSSLRSGKHFKFRLSFITLTLSSTQIHADNVLKALFLNHFLVEAKKKWKVSRYVWRAEQQKNGNIHFHILCDRFIPWSELRDVWNRIQNKLGYVDRYRDNLRHFHENGFRLREDLKKYWPVKKQQRAYQYGVKTDWNNPNSTDIHNLRLVNDIQSYMCKYLTKNQDEHVRFIRIKFLDDCLTKRIPLSDEMLSEFDQLVEYFQEGRLWGCSVNLSNITGAQSQIDNSISSELSKLARAKEVKSYTGDYFSVLFIDHHQLQSLGCPLLSSMFSRYMADEFSFNTQLKLLSG